jgi:SAM-dependent methyltransferase
MADRSADSLYKMAERGVRASFGSDRNRALEYYAPLVDFVTRVRPPSTEGQRLRLLDVGCGCGWSTLAFANAGYDSAGIDLNKKAFEPALAEYFTLFEGSAQGIPFPDAAFNVVVSYQCIEHVPDPEKALLEMARVCKPNGVVCVVGPNLVSPLVPIIYLCKPSSWKRMSYVRKPGLPSHPYGNTLWEIIGLSFLRTFQLLEKMFHQQPHFTMRTPDMTPPFHADNDACYLCNPLDLIAFFHVRGFRVLQRGRHGRPPLSYLLAGGTWIAASKPATSD